MSGAFFAPVLGIPLCFPKSLIFIKLEDSPEKELALKELKKK